MKILSVIASYPLLEANLINGTDKYDGVSIASFVAQYADNLSTPDAKQAFTKKLMRLLSADERFMYAVRELPPNAPAWAKQSFEKGDLVYFQPSEELKDQLDNLSHYVSALEHAIAGADKNEKAVATKELQGLPKAESLDLLFQKAQQYFARGSKKAGADMEGLKSVLETPGGFTWYELQTPTAFQREGKTLQNCIGSHYTLEKTTREHTKIYVLKDNSDASVVATRIIEGKRMAEVKGKQNQPPAPHYMPAVQKFINTYHLDLDSGAKNDVKGAGYYFHEGVLYTKSQAAAKLAHFTVIDTVPGTGREVGSITSNLPELMKDLYGVDTSWGHHKDTKVYAIRPSNGEPTVAVVVERDRTASRIIRLATRLAESEDQPIPRSETGQLLQTLMNKRIISVLSAEVQREIAWHDKLVWNKDRGTITSRTAGEQYTPRQKGTHTLDVYKDVDAQSLARSLLDSDNQHEAEDATAVYTAMVRGATGEEGKTTDKVIAVVQFKDGSIVPYSVRGSEVESGRVGYTRNGPSWRREYVRDPKTANTLIALANENGFKLPLTTVIDHGLTRRDGQYIPMPELTPDKLPGEPAAEKFSIEALNTLDKATALARITSVNDTKPHMSPLKGAAKFTQIKNSIENVVAKSYYSGITNKDTAELTKKIENWTNTLFGDANPTAVYRVAIKYGVDKGGKVTLVASGKDIVAIDSETLKSGWQSRNDYQIVADQLNTFAENNGLTFDRGATKHSPQLRVHRGRVTPAEMLMKSKIEGRHGRDKGITSQVGELKFDDNTIIRKMSTEDAGAWAAHGVGVAVHGTPWEIVKDGNVEGIFLVTKGKALTALYSNPQRSAHQHYVKDVNGQKMPVYKAVDGHLAPYVKAAMSEFGWSSSNQSTLQLKKKSKLGKVLLYIDRHTSVRVNMEPVRQQDGSTTYVSGWDVRNHFRPLQRLGFVTITRDPNSRRETVTQTAIGRAAARELTRAESVNVLDYVTSANLHADYERPEIKPNTSTPSARPTNGEARAPRQPMEGGGSKADQALQKFRELTDANGGTMPTRSAFIALLQQPPFNMTPAGASTYQYNTKAKYMRERGDLNEHFSFKEFLTYIA